MQGGAPEESRAPAWRWALTVLLGALLVLGLAWGRWAVSLVPGALWGGKAHGMAVAGGLSGARSLAPLTADARSWSLAGAALGRQYVHPDLADALGEAFAEERASLSKRRGSAVARWRVAETGWRSGGWFPPHLTHQDGLSVDIVTPLVSGSIPSGPHNRLGYGVELTDDGMLGERAVDFERIARLFDALCTAAPKHDLVARRFIVWEPWHGRIRGRMRSGCRSRLAGASLPHDDHVHVTFTGGS